MQNSNQSMVILEEYEAKESSRKSTMGRNTPMFKRKSQRSNDRCLKPKRAASRGSSNQSSDDGGH